ncbi:MAG: membrane lipoprotein lipid attachment site-containing protein [Deltaproteobacteria bacterium]|nr:membrane lipoprotein lipid attachment site-containing protein [Deltaproteobacteria bacterium]
MKRYIVFAVFVFILAGCGSPRFEIGDNVSSQETFSIAYFFPATENAKNMKVEIPVVMVFTENIDVDSALKGLVIEKTGPGQKQNVKPRCTYIETEMMLQCLPESLRWELKSSYSVKIKDVKSKDGKKTLDKEYSFAFTTI